VHCERVLFIPTNCGNPWMRSFRSPAPSAALCSNNPVLDPEKGECADPVEGDAILGVGGPGPPVGVSERQLSLDRGEEKT
jgi:hypothetical protein